jgi:hypothetical protein
MDIFSYVASANPYQAKAILHKWGYSATNVKNSEDLGVCLRKLVQSEGEDALLDIVDSHPDKGIIIERNVLSTKSDNQYKNCSGDCNCNRNRDYLSFDAQKDRPSSVATQTNVFILSAALILAAAIIVKK